MIVRKYDIQMKPFSIQMMQRRYPYERRGFLITTFLLIIVMVMALFVLVQLNGDVLVLSISILILTLVLLAFGISPLITVHSIEDGLLIIRQGIFFNGKIPLENITKVQRLERVKHRTGVTFSLREPTVFVTTRSIDLITISLSESQRFKSIFGKRIDRVVFDSTENERLINDLNSIIPANQDRSS